MSMIVVLNGRLMNAEKKESGKGSAYCTGQVQDEIRDSEGKFTKRYTNFVAWGKQAESLSNLEKGVSVVLSGDISLETYESKKENKEVTVQKISVSSWSRGADSYVVKEGTSSSTETSGKTIPNPFAE